MSDKLEFTRVESPDDSVEWIYRATVPWRGGPVAWEIHVYPGGTKRTVYGPSGEVGTTTSGAEAARRLAEASHHQHRRRETIRRWVEEQRARAQATLDTWKAKFETSPLYAFEWAADAYHAAAMQSVLAQLDGWAADGISMEGDVTGTVYRADRIATKITGEIRRRGARPGGGSTSPHSNLSHQCQLAAWVHVDETLDSLLDGGWRRTPIAPTRAVRKRGGR